MKPADGASHFHIERGPVIVDADIAPSPARLSDTLVLTIRVDADEKVDVKLPVVGDEISSFTVRGFEQPLAERGNGRRVDVLKLKLEPNETGTFTVPALDVVCTDHRPEAASGPEGGKPFTVTTDPLTVEVQSLLRNEAPTLEKMKPALPPLRVPIESQVPWKWIGGGAVLLALALGLALLARKKRPREQVIGPPPTPAELARREFERLIEDDALGRGELNSFYSELTLIVRRYIERSFGVAAPELTTEEFLREMRRHPAFDQVARERLKSFLESADLVKFAGMRPADGDIEESFRRGQEFAGQATPLALRRTPAGGSA